MGLPDLPSGFAAKADTILADLKAALAPIQADYFALKGRYWQGLQTPLAIPKDGGEATPEKAHHPTDQAETWEDIAVPFPSALPIAVEVHVYDGPSGHGYILLGKVELAGKRWMRAINVGPETWRTREWTAQPVEAP